MASGKKKKRQYLSDFQQTASGEYVYTGNVFKYSGQGSYKKLRLTLGGLCLWMAAAAVICGCIPAAGMKNTFYVILPYLACVLSVATVCWAVVRLLMAGKSVREYILEETVGKLPLRCLFTIVFAAASALAEVIAMIFSDEKGNTGFSLLFLALAALIAGLALALRKAVASMEWEKI